MIRRFGAADHAALASGLARAGADGWLLFDFQGHNPIAGRMLGRIHLGRSRGRILTARSAFTLISE